MALRVSWPKRIFNRISMQCLMSKNCSSTSTSSGYNNLSCQAIPATIFTDEIKFINTKSYDPIPIYRVLGSNSENEAVANIELEKDKFIKMYKDMTTIVIMDKILLEVLRKGRLMFYMSSTGEETLLIASAAAFSLDDIIYTQYREGGVLLWRGYKIRKFLNQLYATWDDSGKGKQMPIHYGSKELNFVTISSTLSTQLPQAVGAAYALKRSSPDRCVAVYFGEGAASEGDAHAAFNFAATLECPVIFICRNNGYAISTPAREQYKGDGIAAKGPAYGINTIRVDGNDVFAMYNATRAARAWALSEKKPVLIEAMVYRVGDHSTSELYLNNDDNGFYRSSDEVAAWAELQPIAKFRNCLEKLGFWSKEQESDFVVSTENEIQSALTNAEHKLKPDWKELFTDVYFNMPNHIKKQSDTMEKHVEDYKEHYPVVLHKQ